MERLLRKYRLSLGIFVFGLIVSGLTAFPLQWELQVLGSLLGIESPERFSDYEGLRRWIAFVQYGLTRTYAQFPFLGYGTDWLAFGHLAIAIFFVRPMQRPLESDWVLKCGLICCAGVVPFALVAGQVREIPLGWRLIDCSFGAVGAIPLVYCLRLTRRMRDGKTSAFRESVELST